MSMPSADTAVAPTSVKIAPPIKLIQRLAAWLHQRPTPSQLAVLLAGALAFQLAWSALGIFVVKVTSTGPVAVPAVMRWLVLEAPLQQALAVLAAGVAIEEMAFRLVPLAVALAIYREWPGTGWVVAAIVVASSVAFGLIHGLEWYRLALQAVGGLLFALVYLKVCGMSGRYWKRAILTTIALHLTFNMAIVIGLRLA